MFFLIKYSKSLEEGSFRGRSADFLWMLLVGKTWKSLLHVMLLCCPCFHLLFFFWNDHVCCCRRSSVNMLCPICEHSVPWFIFDFYDGKLHCSFTAHARRTTTRFCDVLSCCISLLKASNLYSFATFPWCNLQQCTHLNECLNQFACGCTGLCLGAAASIRESELLGHFHFHSAVPALGAAGIQRGLTQLPCGGSNGHAGRSTSSPALYAMLCYAALRCELQC